MILEICTPTIQSAINAELGGAQRIELCANLREGGTTPSAATILACKKHLTIPTFVLIRERGGDFCYSDLEVEVMLQDIVFCRENGIEGVVIGAMTNDKRIHEAHTQAMILAAGDMQITFHRAFDRMENPYQALEILKKMNIHRILTSGQAVSAVLGIPVLKKLMEQAENQLIIMPGAGILPENMQHIIQATGCNEIHFSAKKTVVSALGGEHWESDVEMVKEAINVLNGF
jgi:copper homeostasis protein